jgi:hypothetical protein
MHLIKVEHGRRARAGEAELDQQGRVTGLGMHHVARTGSRPCSGQELTTLSRPADRSVQQHSIMPCADDLGQSDDTPPLR